MTGKRTTRKKRRRKRRRRRKKHKQGGRKISTLGNKREDNPTASDAKRSRNRARRRFRCDMAEAARRQRVCNSVRNKKYLVKRIIFKCPSGDEIFKTVVRERINKEKMGENVAWFDKCRVDGTLGGGYKRKTRQYRRRKTKKQKKKEIFAKRKKKIIYSF